MKQLRQNKDFRMFTFTVINAFISFGLTQLAGLEGDMSILAGGMAIPFLNAFSKYINVRYFSDLGVTKK